MYFFIFKNKYFIILICRKIYTRIFRLLSGFFIFYMSKRPFAGRHDDSPESTEEYIATTLDENN